MDLYKKNKRVLFGIVVYRCYINQSKSLNSLMNSVALLSGIKPNVILYDNSESTYDYANVNKSIANSSGFIYFCNPANPGLPAAYNYFLKYGMETGYEWLVILDQDTLLPENTFEIYIDAASKLHYETQIKIPIVKADNIILSPSRLFFLRNFLFKSLKPGKVPFKSLAFINSGLMLDIQFINKMKGFDERLKLDFVDTDFLLRMQRSVSYIEILPLELSQSFSHFTDDYEGAKMRYMLFKGDLKVMTRIHNNNAFLLYINLLSHAIKLCFKYKTFHFLKEILK